MLNKRQTDILQNFGTKLTAMRNFFTAKRGMPAILAFIMAFFQLFGAVASDYPTAPAGEMLNFDDFTLVWSDEFDGNAVDFTKWQGHYVWEINDTQPRSYGYWNSSYAKVTDGNLRITAKYEENGTRGAGYYSYGMDTNPAHNFSGEGFTGYEQLYGYFETRCILPEGVGLNSAFWLLTDGMFRDDYSDGGVSGCEIDVFETPTDFTETDKLYGSVYSTVHIGGYEEDHQMEMQGKFYTDNNPYKEYNTYGFKWDESGYTFYINGRETAHTDFGGACAVPMYLIIDIIIDSQVVNNSSLPQDLVVDYIRAYQFNSKL